MLAGGQAAQEFTVPCHRIHGHIPRARKAHQVLDRVLQIWRPKVNQHPAQRKLLAASFPGFVVVLDTEVINQVGQSLAGYQHR